MAVAGLIVAAGRGRRLGDELPKQYRIIGSRSVLARAAEAMLAHSRLTHLLVLIHPDDRALYRAAMASVNDARLLPPALGAEERSGSVLAGLEALAAAGPAPEHVLIHDAARPFLACSTIEAVLAALGQADGACPVLPVVDALWQGAGGEAGAPVDRAGLWRAQTPQGFRFTAILAAHRQHRGGGFLDDVAVARAAGLTVRLVPGEEAAFKITTPADLQRAQAIAEAEERMDAVDVRVDVRTGNGYDVHAFGPGAGVTLCGVAVPHERGLVGHSDADVGLHALTDAIFGALAEGDIGRWFPPSDARWQGADSSIFLSRAAARAAERGFAVSHLDVTLVCERPKIGPHADAMRAEIARITGIEAERVSVKATTSERLGFTGREEGIAALATATLVRQG